jgi:recombination protein RecA
MLTNISGEKRRNKAMAKKKGPAKTVNKVKEEDKDKALELAISALEKEFGKGVVITGQSNFPEIPKTGSGSIQLDKALNGGYPKGRIIEIYGPESSGKTTLTLHAIAEYQKDGGRCAFIDAEHALDIHYAAALGVDIDNLLISQPDSGEQALQVAEKLTRSGVVDMIVIDSVSALVPRAELEGEIGDSSVGLQARLMSQAMRMLIGCARESETTIMFINQIRMKIGVMFGNPETTSGGNALKFYASQRLDIRRIKTLGTDDDKFANRVRVKVIKNKVGPPFRKVEFNINFGKGIDWANDILEMGLATGLIDRAGAWYSYKGERLGQGATNTAKHIEENPELAEELKSILLGNKEEGNETHTDTGS